MAEWVDKCVCMTFLHVFYILTWEGKFLHIYIIYRNEWKLYADNLFTYLKNGKNLRFKSADKSKLTDIQKSFKRYAKKRNKRKTSG